VCDRKVFVFAGPSLFGSGIDCKSTDLVWLPPAKRGDIDQLLSTHSEPGVIALADGTFHAYPSVRHIELRDGLDKGWIVFGLCSMGAIRACEMEHLGMRGYGEVARRFREDEDFADDEVALIHGSEEPWAPLSEPLIHIRAYLDDMRDQGLLDARQIGAIIQTMQCRWYGYRTIPELFKAVSVACGGVILGKALDGLRNFKRYRVKQRDLKRFVEDRPWVAPTLTIPPNALIRVN
jgi:hypothetical protein